MMGVPDSPISVHLAEGAQPPGRLTRHPQFTAEETGGHLSEQDLCVGHE